MDASQIPGADQLRELLASESAPPRLTLDIGGSADINGDGLVTVSLDADGALVFEDA